VGQVVEVALSTYALEVRAKDRLIARHARCHGRDQTILELEHYLPALARKPRSVRHAAVITQLPPIYGTVRDQLCRGRPDGYRAFAALLLLCQEFPVDAVTEALEEAHQRGCLEVSAVRQLLLNRLASAHPAPIAVPERLVGLELAPPDLTQYNTLLREQPA
jgi:hypothetical protein